MWDEGFELLTTDEKYAKRKEHAKCVFSNSVNNPGWPCSPKLEHHLPESNYDILEVGRARSRAWRVNQEYQYIQ